jgi:hypothetical protein
MSNLPLFTARTIGEPFRELHYGSLEELRKHFSIYAGDVVKLLNGVDIFKSWGNRKWVLSKNTKTKADAGNTPL